MASKSQNTIALEAQVSALNAKIERLTSAKTKLDGTSVRLGSTYSNMDALHVKGTKYDEMKATETSELKGIKKKFSSKKDEVLGELNSAIAQCNFALASAQASLSASRIWDSLTETASQIEKTFTGK